MVLVTFVLIQDVFRQDLILRIPPPDDNLIGAGHPTCVECSIIFLIKEPWVLLERRGDVLHPATGIASDVCAHPWQGAIVRNCELNVGVFIRQFHEERMAIRLIGHASIRLPEVDKKLALLQALNQWQ